MTYPLPMFPLGTVLFPEACLPLHVFEDRYRALMAHCLEGGLEFGVVLIARGSEVGGGDLRTDVGTVARIDNVAELDEGRLLVVATGQRRIRVEGWLPDAPFPQAEVEDLPPSPCANCSPVLVSAEASVRRLRWLLSELEDVPPLSPQLQFTGHPEQVGWELCDMAPLTSLDQQRLLAEEGLANRMALLIDMCDALAEDVNRMLAGGSPSSN